MLGGVLADDVVRWRGDLRESAHPFRGITDTTERRELEPGSRSVLEALGRAQFDTRRYDEAAATFRRIVEASPSDDYAQFGLGLALARGGNPRAAAEHLALAAAMRPELRHYTEALQGVRATLRARAQAAGEPPGASA